MTDNEEYICRFIADYYGYENQTDKTFEEMDELKEAVKSGDNISIAEEIADVEIMLEQIAYMKDIKKLIAKTIDQKLDRQMERIFANADSMAEPEDEE